MASLVLVGTVLVADHTPASAMGSGTASRLLDKFLVAPLGASILAHMVHTSTVALAYTASLETAACSTNVQGAR